MTTPPCRAGDLAEAIRFVWYSIPIRVIHSLRLIFIGFPCSPTGRTALVLFWIIPWFELLCPFVAKSCGLLPPFRAVRVFRGSAFRRLEPPPAKTPNRLWRPLDRPQIREPFLHHFLHLADRKCLICKGPVEGIAPLLQTHARTRRPDQEQPEDWTPTTGRSGRGWSAGFSQSVRPLSVKMRTSENQAQTLEICLSGIP